jgi:hypothetical protein
MVSQFAPLYFPLKICLFRPVAIVGANHTSARFCSR